MRRSRSTSLAIAVICAASLLAGCTKQQPASQQQPRTTKRDKTGKGAAIGAASGAVLGALLGEGELDEILMGAAIGGGIGAGVGAYMDKQEEDLARIPGTSVERVGEDMLLVHFESDVLFSVDSAVLNSTSRSSLDQAAGVFTEYPKTAILAQGHTDSTGSEEHNQDLSERRAQAVSNYLVARGVDPTRITSLGYGEGNPVASNESESGRRQNRRVDLLLKAKAR
jgi:outer membrane protein OmpA-like peptidoglycan-associated protein